VLVCVCALHFPHKHALVRVQCFILVELCLNFN